MNHKDLQVMLDSGRELPFPDGILINGKRSPDRADFTVEQGDETLAAWHVDSNHICGLCLIKVWLPKPSEKRKEMELGTWSEESRDSYNLVDAISRCTVQYDPDSPRLKRPISNSAPFPSQGRAAAHELSRNFSTRHTRPSPARRARRPPELRGSAPVIQPRQKAGSYPTAIYGTGRG
ncbi:hypothetical protein C2845_PM15G17660 [Panicum miliaceum]|uniref:Uncharacterized protein n=1 Tax=Panicum miliaceum TaxID=4540 RepID=A0A3L6Q800_PANMI|nr:hypothetical protein C2845_PM15G17660 [Panicum miliaceum]